MRRTYVDSGVLIWAARGHPPNAQRAFEILDDPGRSFASSTFVKLEVIPEATYPAQWDEVAFYEEFFKRTEAWVDASDNLAQAALSQALQHGLSAMDALHVASALAAQADELVTAERVTKPIHRVSEIRVIAIRQGAGP